MPKPKDATDAAAGATGAAAPPLPDLSGVDLRTLRSLDTPAVTAAVDHVLRHPRDVAEDYGANDPPTTGPSPLSTGRCGGAA
ncbi:hypothetical protein E0L36_11765 [Streptomyces sp. AJS327]|uniref:hypothetical protein n=1 Tax=Streptomyces sp. AJS327 TaxID=2545265 RepID=UPI0015DE3A81|nr:hypothetical protein [Streptomyces sp. AJS327]MBA0051545.1 hypothetical protein [Streptomyces sp. AJS327]